MLFLKASTTKPRGSLAYHIIIEEAHRYVQHDNDIELLGYNIFERISKEGRKYGMFLALITQRPSELSDTCVSQCMNFVILRTLHPVDLKYIREMVPNVSSEIVLQLKNLKPGNCIAFGSAFKVPTSMYVDLPNPRPLSNNVDLEKVWYESRAVPATSQTITADPNSVSSIMAQQNQVQQTQVTQNQMAQQQIQQQIIQPDRRMVQQPGQVLPQPVANQQGMIQQQVIQRPQPVQQTMPQPMVSQPQPEILG